MNNTEKHLEMLKRLFQTATKLDDAYMNLTNYGTHIGGEKYDEINDVLADVEEYLQEIHQKDK